MAACKNPSSSLHTSGGPEGIKLVTERPRVLIVITLAEVGGAQSYVASLVPALVGAFDVAVAAHGPGPLPDAVRKAGSRFIALSHVRRPIRPWRDLLGLLELVRVCRRERPHILHANSSKAGVLARLAACMTGVPIRIFTVHGWAFSAHSGSAARLYAWADRIVGALTTMTVCVSENDRRAGLRARTCRPDRSVVIRNAVDVAAAPRARRDGGTPRLIAVGRLQAPKDFMTLIGALAHLTPGSFRAVIAGSGPDRPALDAEIGRLRLSDAVEILGEREDVPQLLAEADIFVLSSRSEGLPISILEAMAAGLPVVASAVGGVPEAVVDGETGMVVAPGDRSALAAALDRLVGSPDLRSRLGSVGRVRAKKLFDLPAFRRAHIELYSELLEARGLPGPEP
jgi:glycosyltransferase involved in cell wall biosynthesis